MVPYPGAKGLPALGGKEGSWLADAVHALVVLAAYGINRQPHFLAQGTRDEPAPCAGAGPEPWRSCCPRGRWPPASPVWRLSGLCGPSWRGWPSSPLYPCRAPHGASVRERWPSWASSAPPEQERSLLFRRCCRYSFYVVLLSRLLPRSRHSSLRCRTQASQFREILLESFPGPGSARWSRPAGRGGSGWSWRPSYGQG